MRLIADSAKSCKPSRAVKEDRGSRSSGCHRQGKHLNRTCVVVLSQDFPYFCADWVPQKCIKILKKNQKEKLRGEDGGSGVSSPLVVLTCFFILRSHKGPWAGFATVYNRINVGKLEESKLSTSAEERATRLSAHDNEESRVKRGFWWDYIDYIGFKCWMCSFPLGGTWP